MKSFIPRSILVLAASAVLKAGRSMMASSVFSPRPKQTYNRQQETRNPLALRFTHLAAAV